MLARRALARRFRAFNNIAAIYAVPFHSDAALEGFFIGNVLYQLAISRFMEFLNFRNLLKRAGYLVKTFIFCRLCKVGI